MLPFHISPYIHTVSSLRPREIALKYPIPGFRIDPSLCSTVHSKKTRYNTARNQRIAASESIICEITHCDNQQCCGDFFTLHDMLFFKRRSISSSIARIFSRIILISPTKLLVNHLSRHALPMQIVIQHCNTPLLCGLIFSRESTLYLYSLNLLPSASRFTHRVSLVQFAVSSIIDFAVDNGYECVDLLVGDSQYKGMFATSSYYTYFSFPSSLKSLYYFPNLFYLSACILCMFRSFFQ